jgi:trimeric autotransporter adhesin
MTRKLCLPAVIACLVLTCSFALAVQVPISVYPDPIQFGTVALNGTGYPVPIYLSNVTSNSVNVTGMNISGTNAGDFAFYGATCAITISAGQTCQMYMVFTPSAMGSRAATLRIAVGGLTTPIGIPLQGAGGNPIPTVTSLSPSSAYVGGPTLTLTINGSGFMSSSAVYWNNSLLTTTYLSSTQLTAQVPSSELSQTGSIYVYVANPQPGGGSSAGVTFNVIALDPFLNNASPTSVGAGSAPTPIIVSGSNFMNGASVLWNGKSVPTTYLNSQQLQFQPSSGQLSSAGIVQLSVSNPRPGGVSSALNFNVTYPVKVTVLNLPANDLVWDPFAQRIYASLPSSFGSNGNTIAVINPAKGVVNGYHFAGSEPNQIALSADSHYLYVGLNGDGSVQRLILPKFTPDIDINLGSSSYSGVNLAGSLQVSPGDSHTIAVALGNGGCCGGGPLEFFTDSTLLANSISYPSISDIAFANATTLYGFEQGTLTQVAVSSTGGTVVTQWNGLVNGQDIHYDAGLLYSSQGQVFNPSTGLLVGIYDVSAGCCGSAAAVLPDAAINRVFSLGNSIFFNNSFAITSYNLSKFTPLALTNLSQFNGNNPTPTFIRWGSNGLAFTMQAGCCGNTSTQVVLVQSPSMLLTASGTPNPAPVMGSLSPASVTHGSNNKLVTITGSGFVPGSQVTWNGGALYAEYVNATRLLLYVPAADLATTGSANVVVTNPAPGGGSSTLTFTIN